MINKMENWKINTLSELQTKKRSSTSNSEIIENIKKQKEQRNKKEGENN